MAESKKYLSVFNDGTQDLYIKDAEAREQIQEIENQLVLETEGGVDTLFDTSYDAENEMIVFGKLTYLRNSGTLLLSIVAAEDIANEYLESGGRRHAGAGGYVALYISVKAKRL